MLGEAGFAEISFQHFSYFWREYGIGGDPIGENAQWIRVSKQAPRQDSERLSRYNLKCNRDH